MTAEVSHSRSKRRKLPRRNIVDYEYVAPSKNTDMEQNLGLLKSARLRSVLSEVWGEEGTNAHRASQPIVIDQQYSTLVKKRTMSGTKSLLDKLKEHEEQVDLDLSNVVIIPPSQNKKHSTSASASPLASIDSNSTVNNIEQQETHEKLASKQQNTCNTKNVSKQDDGTCTNTLSSPPTATQHNDITTHSSHADELLLAEGPYYTQVPDAFLVDEEEEEEGDAYLIADKEDEAIVGTDNTKEVIKDDYQYEKEHEKKEVLVGNSDTFVIQSPPNDAHLAISDCTSTPLSQDNNKDLQQEQFLPSQGILRKWNLAQRTKAKHRMLRMMKESSALDWVVDGPDLDARKENVGMIRKQQLHKKLNKPFLERKKIQKSASSWY